MRQTGASPLRPGDPGSVGPYVPLGLLGSGGMGRVYLARPADDGPGLVAVKVIRPEYAEDPRFRRRFEREASVHARLRTPHTSRLCGTGFQDEMLWMATEYLPGLDLAVAVREVGALETAAVWRLAAQLGQALADLSAAGIVHRDLKPSNVLLSVRGAHVIDFGISKAADASAITGTGNRVGTPAYMSPEHLREGRCDTAADVFSLAGTLVYAATGHAPFGDGTGVDVMHRVAFEEPNPELIGAIAEADPALGSLLSACLAKEPGRRPTPRQLVEAARGRAPDGWPEPLHGRVLARLRAFEALRSLPRAAPSGSPEPEERGGPSAATPAEQAPRARTWARRKPLLTVAAAAVLCAVAAGVLLLPRHDTTAGAPPTATGGTTEVGASPPDTTAPVSEAADGTSGPSGAGKGAGDAVGTGVHTSRPAVPRSTDDVRRADHSGSTAGPAASAGTASSTSATHSGPATPPWISDCTYYHGNGRTRAGNSGKRVLQVQCMLTKRGYDVGSTGVDGDFGSGTEAAVREFQSDKGLGADGVVGRETWGALRGTA
ncbi:protein kinase domain-containing protein [Streptomyces sp. NPDC001348]